MIYIDGKGVCCTVCQAPLDEVMQAHKYEDFACPTCGQRYAYDEGHSIHLSDAQIAALRKLRAAGAS